MKQINIKLLKAIETITNDDDILGLWDEFAHNDAYATGWNEYLNSGWEYAEVFEYDIYMFLNGLKFYWEAPMWSYISTTKLVDRVKNMRGIMEVIKEIQKILKDIFPDQNTQINSIDRYKKDVVIYGATDVFEIHINYKTITLESFYWDFFEDTVDKYGAIIKNRLGILRSMKIKGGNNE